MDADTLTIRLKKLALEFPPGILRPGQTFDDHIGNTVVNLSDLVLTQTQVEVSPFVLLHPNQTYHKSG
jgi:hypothetical protein